MLILGKSNIVAFNKKSVASYRLRPVQVCTPDNAILSSTVIVEYLSHKHIDLSLGASIKSVINTMNDDQYKLLVALAQDVILHELKGGLFIIIAILVLFSAFL